MVSEPSICFYWMNSIGKITGKKQDGQTILEMYLYLIRLRLESKKCYQFTNNHLTLLKRILLQAQ